MALDIAKTLVTSFAGAVIVECAGRFGKQFYSPLRA